MTNIQRTKLEEERLRRMALILNRLCSMAGGMQLALDILEHNALTLEDFESANVDKWHCLSIKEALRWNNSPTGQGIK